MSTIQNEIGLAISQMEHNSIVCKAIKTFKVTEHEWVENDYGDWVAEGHMEHIEAIFNSSNIENAWINMDLICHWLNRLNEIVKGSHKDIESETPTEVPEYMQVNDLILKMKSFERLFGTWVRATVNPLIREPIREICIWRCYSLTAETIYWLTQERDDLMKLEEKEL